MTGDFQHHLVNNQWQIVRFFTVVTDQFNNLTAKTINKLEFGTIIGKYLCSDPSTAFSAQPYTIIYSILIILHIHFNQTYSKKPETCPSCPDLVISMTSGSEVLLKLLASVSEEPCLRRFGRRLLLKEIWSEGCVKIILPPPHFLMSCNLCAGGAWYYNHSNEAWIDWMIVSCRHVWWMIWAADLYAQI